MKRVGNYSETEQSSYDKAYKRVKQIQGFYSHALVYGVINIVLLILRYTNLDNNESIFELHNFSTALFWGIGLLSHALSVFVPNMILSSNWREKKIQELMQKENENL